MLVSLYVIRPPNPAAGHDWLAAVPGQWLYHVTGITARLDANTAAFSVLHDSSGHGNDGSYSPANSGFPAFVAGLVAGDLAVQWGFAPAGGFFARATTPAPLVDWSGDFTIEGWLEQGATNTSGGGLFQAYNNAGRQAVAVSSDPATSQHIVVARNNPQELTVTTNGTFPCDGLPHHVVVTYSAGTMKVYVDGAAVTFGTDDPHLAQTITATHCTIAGNNIGGNGSSLISDEVAVYDHALTAARALAHYNAAAVSFAAYSAAVLADAPAGYYHLDDVAGTSGRQVCLEITDGNVAVALVPTGFVELAAGGPWLYSWQPGVQSNAEAPAAGTFTVSIPDLVIPAGYTMGTRTLDLQPGDRWSDVTIWWDSDVMDALNPINPYVFPPSVHLVYEQRTPPT